MKDTELYEHLLGLQSPWFVERVELDKRAQRVTVFAAHDEDASFKCAECGRTCPLHDHDEERSWRHLDSCQFETHLRARVPRVRCDKHGVRQARVPWAEPKSRFTLMFERFAIDVLSEPDVLGATKILRISWDQAHHIMQRAVERGLARREHADIKHMGVDEKAIAKGHRYATLLKRLAARHRARSHRGAHTGEHREMLGQRAQRAARQGRGVRNMTVALVIAPEAARSWRSTSGTTDHLVPLREGISLRFR